MRWLPILMLASCLAPTGDPRERSFDVAGELEGGSEWLVDAVPGQSFSGNLTTCHPAEASPALGCMNAYLLEVPAGESVVVALEPGAQLRPELLIKAPDYTLVTHATEQTLYEHLPASFPFAVVEQGTYVVFVSGEGYASGGDYELHFATLTRPLAFPLDASNTTAGLVTDDLRDLSTEPNRDRIVEKGDGFVEIESEYGVPVDQRLALRRLEAAINEDRRTLFQILAARAEQWVELQTVASDWLLVRATLDPLH